MMTTREKVLDRLAQKGWRVNRLAQLAQKNGICTRQSVYNWLSARPGDIGSEKADAIWALLDVK